MKRYVNEFAADIRRSLSGTTQDVRKNAEAEIQEILRVCDRGMISDREAIECLLRVPMNR